MIEETQEIVKTFTSGKPGSLVVVIPSQIRKRLGIRKGEHLMVSVDSDGRIVYERIPLPVRHSKPQ